MINHKITKAPIKAPSVCPKTVGEFQQQDVILEKKQQCRVTEVALVISMIVHRKRINGLVIKFKQETS